MINLEAIQDFDARFGRVGSMTVGFPLLSLSGVAMLDKAVLASSSLRGMSTTSMAFQIEISSGVVRGLLSEAHNATLPSLTSHSPVRLDVIRSDGRASSIP